jgi:small-conductance mechanosensitive channel
MLSNLSDTLFFLLRVLIAVGGGFIVGLIVAWIIFSIFKRYGKDEDNVLFRSINRNLRRPAFFFIPVVFALLSLPFTGLGAEGQQTMGRILEIMLYLFGAWMIIETTDVVGDLIKNAYRIDVKDNLQERKIITQLVYVKRLVAVVVFTIAVAFILLQFEKVRELGAGLLTSAGVAGIIIGFAAQKSIANLLAGFQLAFTQPIRIDDVVIVEGEWGRIEEITLTYVVIRIWDLRRLVVPLNYFNEKPFQNWTRTSADILGTVFLYLDYSVPIDAIRQELTRLLENNDLWDGRVNGVQVTDSKERYIEVRALMSAADASKAWDLRCYARENLIAFIRENYPDSLPKTRVEMGKGEEN